MSLLLIILITSQLKNTIHNSMQDAKGLYLNKINYIFLECISTPPHSSTTLGLGHFVSLFWIEKQKTAPSNCSSSTWAQAVTDVLRMLDFVIRIFFAGFQPHHNQWCSLCMPITSLHLGLVWALTLVCIHDPDLSQRALPSDSLFASILVEFALCCLFVITFRLQRW